MSKKIEESKRILISIVTFITLIIIFTGILNAVEVNYGKVYGGDSGKELITLREGVEFRLRGKTLFDLNPQLYCVERGKKIPDELLRYKCSREYWVQDEKLVWILTQMPDEEKHMGSHSNTNVKQNMIWWYLQQNPNSLDAQFIKSQGKDHHSNGPAMSIDRLQPYIDQMNKDINAKASYQLTVSELRFEGNEVKFEVSGTYDAYEVYYSSDNVNFTYEGRYTSNGTRTIDKSKFRKSSSAYVKVKGIKKKKSASIFVLYRDTSQKFIVISQKGEEEEGFGDVGRDKQLSTNVSLQKYISEVNNRSLTSIYGSDQSIIQLDSSKTIDQRKANDTPVGESLMYQRWSKKDTSGSKVGICSSNGGSRIGGGVHANYQNSAAYYKANNPVNIEKGDLVTYNVYVYNNDKECPVSDITVTDRLSNASIDGSNVKLESIALAVERKNASGYIGQNINYKVQNGQIQVTGISLNEGETARITIKIRFNIQINGIIRNYAVLSVANNETTFRTEDADYVRMRQYKVSLEKFISNVSNNTSINVGESAYSYIISYLKKYNLTNMAELENLINQYKTQPTSTEYAKYDLNKDGKVDERDLELYNSKNIGDINSKISAIEEYIKADLNQDGKVNEQDLDIFLALKADLNGDKKLDANDRYMYILKILLNRNLLNEDTLNYLKAQRLSIRNGQNLSDTVNEISNFIKSDVNDDGHVNEQDYYKIVDNFVIEGANVNQRYELRVNENINQLTKEELSELAKKIKLYDVNSDGILDNQDIIMMNEYAGRFNANSRYFYICRQDNRLKSYKDKFIEKFTIVPENPNFDMALNINNDDVIDFNDYAFLLELNEENNEYSNLVSRIDKLLTITNNSIYDLDANGVANYEDYKILMEYAAIKEKIEDAGNSIINANEVADLINKYSIYDQDTANKDLTSGDLSVIKVYKGWKLYDEKYMTIDYSNYDLNSDGYINQADLDLINDNENNEAADILTVILNRNDIDNFITEFNKAMINPNTVRNMHIDIEVIKDYSTLNDIINRLSSSSLLSNVTNLEEGIDRSYIEEKSKMNINDLDMNKDKSLNESDIDYLKQLSGIGDITTIAGFDLSIIRKNDLDGDGDWDLDDIGLAEEIRKVQDDAQAKKEIIDIISNTNTNASLLERPGHAEHKYNENRNNLDNWKYNHVVADVKTGDIITYTIKVTNNSDETSVYVSEITDYMPNGVKYLGTTYSGSKYCTEFNPYEYFEANATGNTVKCTNVSKILLRPGQSVSFNISVEVIEPNISANILKNTAKITGLINKNRVSVTDLTPNDNIDSDYFQMKDITISGTVWNDIAWDKKQNNYDGIYENETGKDKPLEGVKVYLYRRANAYRYDLNGDGRVDDNDITTLREYIVGINNLVSGASADIDGNGRVTTSDLLTLKNIIMNNTATKYTRETGNTLVTMTTTDANGRYTFGLNYIKGPKITNTNRWAGTYYSYYVVFEYDGVTYTASLWKDVTSNDPYDSNAREDIGRVNKTRQAFNNQFSIINNHSGIQYSTKNEKGYIPQSNHIAKDANGNLLDKYKMQSSTALISLSKSSDLEQQLQHVNLGLRGRDVFDLELKTDIYSTKVSVNGKQGAYQYNNNKVTLRRTDISNEYSYSEDMEHVYSQRSSYEGDIYNQGIRKTDIDVNKTGSGRNGTTKYAQTGLEIEVTYKVTVTNTSATDGTATKITDYYDSRYNFVRAYSSDGKTLTTSTGTSGTGYKSVRTTTPGTNLSRNETMDIYLVFTLNNPTQTLKALADGTLTRIPTYNIAEIEEYRTRCAKNQTEYIRGLLDKNSAPGSANKEQVRLTSTEGQNTATINGNPTTIGYYFGRTAEERKALKYENDTYEAPVLYFTAATGLPKPDPEKPADPVDPTDPDDPDNPSHPDIPGDNGYAREITGIVFRDTTTTNQTTKIKTGNGKLDRGEVGVYGATVSLIEVKKNLIGGVGEEIAVRYRVTTNKNGRFTISGFLPGDYILRYEYGDTTNTVLLNQAAQDINKYSFNGEDYQSTNNTGNYGAAKLNATSGFWYVYNEKDGISTATDDRRRRSTVSTNVTNFTDEQMTVLNNMRDGKNAEQSKVSYQKDGKTETVTVNNIIDQTKMNAGTELMEFLVEKTENLGDRLVQRSVFGKYTIRNMNFGIAEVPVTTIDLQKHVQAFKITDSTGKNVLASMAKDENGKWQTKGNVLAETFDISIEDEQLQGARLEITYDITSKMATEKNFDNRDVTVPTIKGIVDYIDNNLSYNPALGDNAKYWELTNYDDTVKEYAKSKYREGTEPKGTVDPEGTIYTTIVKAKENNPILLTTAGQGTATITLEKVLSATDATIDQIVTSTIETFAYSNTVEITGLDHKNVTPEGGIPQRDRIRTPDRYIIIPGVQHDSATSEEIVIHPPTGDNSISVTYYVLAVVSLIILGAGTFSIKKFVLRTKK